MTKEVATPYGVNLRRSIISLWNEFKGNTKIKVNDGRKTRFWYDDWHEAGIMISLYPEIHNLVSQQQRSIAEMWTPEGWEFKGTQEGDDELWWQDTEKGAFKVGKAYKKMNNNNQLITNCPWKNIWKTKIPYKVACFVWLLSKEVVLTKENLMKGGITLTPSCITGKLWRLFLSLGGISGTMPGKVTETLQSWKEVWVQVRDRRRWRIIPATIWRTIRKERNSRIFENIENSTEQVNLIGF
ncbi:unnamed protein product [Withania somnifera]